MVRNTEYKRPHAACSSIMASMLPAAPSRRRLPDLQALNAFVTVCDAGSIGVAAQRLGMSQSAVSQAIKGLEQE